MNKTKITTLLTMIVLLTLTACGGSGGGSSSSANSCDVLNVRSKNVPKVFGGDLCSQEARSPVLLLAPIATDGQIIDRVGTCSAALVTVDDFLTSAHCFINPILEAAQAGIEVVGFVALAGGDNGEVLEIVNAEIHPSYDGNVGSQFDIAMGTLSKVPSPAIGPLPILVSELTGAGSSITAFGYGTNQNNLTDELRASNFTVSGIEEGNLIVIGDGNSSVCPGDSGGPAVYVNSQGISTLAGVNSFILGDGCVPNAARVFGFVDIQNDQILNFISGYAPDVSAG